MCDETRAERDELVPDGFPLDLHLTVANAATIVEEKLAAAGFSLILDFVSAEEEVLSFRPLA